MIRLDDSALDAIADAVAARLEQRLRTRVDAGEKYETLDVLAERFSVERATLRAWARAGRLKALRAGRSWRATASAVEAAMSGSAAPPAASAPARPAVGRFLTAVRAR